MLWFYLLMSLLFGALGNTLAVFVRQLIAERRQAAERDNHQRKRGNMAEPEFDTEMERMIVDAWLKARDIGTQRVLARRFLSEIDRLRAENQRLTDLNRRAQAIITDAITHGMPVTKEVAAVRNGIVCGKESPANG